MIETISTREERKIPTRPAMNGEKRRIRIPAKRKKIPDERRVSGDVIHIICIQDT
jgi:hypothetical protein